MLKANLRDARHLDSVPTATETTTEHGYEAERVVK
jgi:hypothetical protein